MFTRRGFVRISAGVAGSLALRPFGMIPGLAAQSSPNYQALVCIFLFGGNDSNNMIVPMDDANYKAYQSIRSTLALSTSELTAPVTSASGEPYSFHGKLPDLASLFASKELAVVANVGPLVQPVTRAQYQAQNQPLPNNLFSHADQQQAWQTSIAQGHAGTGWAGRAADYIAQQKINSSSFPTFLSVAGNTIQGVGTQTGAVTVTPGESLTLKGFNKSAASEARWNAMNNLLQLDNGVLLAQAADTTLSHSIADAAALTSALASSTLLKTQFPATGLGGQLQQIAQIIQVQSQLGMRRQIFFASLSGFDTHAGETDTLNTLYAELSPALAAFYAATQELNVAENVTTFTESDFSRTFQPTSSDGSDHAWGSHHLVLGGSVKGGQVYGAFPAFELGGPNDTDTRGRWIPTTSTDQYGATMCAWFGIQPGALSTVFPNLHYFPTPTLGFLG